MDETFNPGPSVGTPQTPSEPPKTQQPYKQEVQDIFSDTESIDPIPPTTPRASFNASAEVIQSQPEHQQAQQLPITRSGGLSRKTVILIAGGFVALLAIVGGIFLLLNLAEKLPKIASSSPTTATVPAKVNPPTQPVQPTPGTPQEVTKSTDTTNSNTAQQPATPATALDSDKDGLTDVEEALYKTNPNLPDSDNDGVSDYDEVKIYKTLPNNTDTDGDGYLDGEEVRTAHNPNGPGLMPVTP